MVKIRDVIDITLTKEDVEKIIRKYILTEYNVKVTSYSVKFEEVYPEPSQCLCEMPPEIIIKKVDIEGIRKL